MSTMRDDTALDLQRDAPCFRYFKQLGGRFGYPEHHVTGMGGKPFKTNVWTSEIYKEEHGEGGNVEQSPEGATPSTETYLDLLLRDVLGLKKLSERCCKTFFFIYRSARTRLLTITLLSP